MLCNSGCIYSDYDDVRYVVYKWGFPYLDYSFDVLISWSCNLGCTAGFVVFAFIGFYSYFRFYYYCYYNLYSWLDHLCTIQISCYSLLYTACLMPDITFELLSLISWLVYSRFIQILSYRIISWWFILFYLVVIVDSSGCAYSVDRDMRYMVYRWAFLDYHLDVSISWIYLLSPYNWFY